MKDKYLPLVATITVFVVAFAVGGVSFNHFLSTNVLGDLLTDNAFIIICAVGETFVILTGGIDLSVGSMIGFVGVVMAHLDTLGWHPLASAAAMIAFGIAFGVFQGVVVDLCEIQPFIITLAGLFLLRGGCFMVSLDSIPINHPFVGAFADWHIDLGGGGRLSLSAIVMLLSLAAGVIIAHFTKFGANIYAMGGDPQSAKLMGVPVRSTTIKLYALAGLGDELIAIAAVVLGGTLVTGGVGLVFGTLFGGLIQGLITTLVNFQGSLTSWWATIIVGVLLFVFIVAQRTIINSFMGRRAV